MGIRVDLARAFDDSEYCGLIIRDLENDIISGDVNIKDRVLEMLRLMQRLNEFVELHAEECDDCNTEPYRDGHR